MRIRKNGVTKILCLVLLWFFILGMNTQVWAAKTPDSPAGISGSAASQTQINLKWKSVTGAVSFNIYRCNASANGSYVKIASGIKKLSYNDSRNILAGAPYWYQISSTGQNGEGAKSSAIKINAQNPTRQEIINKISAACKKKGIPELLGLATAWTESSGFKQFTSDGNFKISSDNGLGMMQITNKDLDEYTRFKLLQDWNYNVEYGIGSLADARKYVMKYGDKKKDLDSEDHIARASYSVYNNGKSKSSISRWREKNDKRDKNFYKNYTNQPW